MNNMKISIGSDHASYTLKEHVKAYLENKGFDILDMGTFSSEVSVDYPDYALAVCEKVVSNEAKFGILLCGTGLGMSIAANKVNGIRAALCPMPDYARLAREHNDANILVLGGRIMGIELAEWTVDKFLTTDFQGGRHSRRLNKISEIEKL